MKSIVGVILSVIVTVHCAAIENQVSPMLTEGAGRLFESAWKYQNELKELQIDIDEQMVAVQNAIPTILRSSTADALTRIEGNINALVAIDEPVRNEIYALVRTACVTNLRVLLNGLTEFTGFSSANCVTSYDLKVQKELNAANEEIEKYRKSFGVQETVVRSFIGLNVFLDAEAIETRFSSRVANVSAEWERIRPDVLQFAKNLSVTISEHNTNLGDCFQGIQDKYPPQYKNIKDQIATCDKFDNTADPFAQFRL